MTAPGTIAISIPTEASNSAAPVQAAQAAAAAIQTAAIQASQIQVLTTSPITSGHSGPYAEHGDCRSLRPSGHIATCPVRGRSYAGSDSAAGERIRRAGAARRPATRFLDLCRSTSRPCGQRRTNSSAELPTWRGLAGWDADAFQLAVDGGHRSARGRCHLRRHESA